MKYYFKKTLRYFCYKISITGAVNSGKSSFHNNLLDQLKVNYKKSIVNHVENYCLEDNKNVFEINKRKCLITDTIGINEQMIKKFEKWKLKEYNFKFENNNIIKNYFNIITNSNLVLICIKHSEIRHCDILSYRIINDIYKNHNNIFTIIFNNSINKCDKIEYNYHDIYENFKNIIFYPYILDSYDKNDDLIEIIKKSIKQNVQINEKKINSEISNINLNNNEIKLENNEIKLENNEIKLENNEIKLENNEMKIENNEIKLENNEIKLENNEMKLENNEIKLENSEIYDLIDESIRIFHPSLSEETRNYFYKFVDLKKKDKSNIKLFNEYFSKNILNKTLKKISEENIYEKNKEIISNDEEKNLNKLKMVNKNNENTNDIEEINSDDSMHNNEENTMSNELNEYFFNKIQNNNFEEKKKVIDKLKNKKIQILKNIINRNENTNPYELIKLNEIHKNINEKIDSQHKSESKNDFYSSCDTFELNENENNNNLKEINNIIESNDDYSNKTKSRKKYVIDYGLNDEITICVLGEKNCGKTTLIQSILKNNIINEKDVFELFGKRKYINNDLSVYYKNKKIEILDTCSLKKQHKFRNEDNFSDEKNRVFSNIRKSDICIYIKEVKNNSISLNKDDKKMMFYLLKEKKNIIFVVNKIDLIISNFENKRSEFLKTFSNSFNDIPIIFLNSNNINHINALLNKIIFINKMNNITISTSILNLFLIEFLKLFPIPWLKKTKCHFKFIKQIKTNPLTFLIFTNLYKKIPNNYLTFFKKKLKSEFDLKYINIQFIFKTTCNNRNIKKNQIIK
ncbi:GTP-binding protein EngA, putative [Plasmodium gallinaceum]|uniref:GTP-binding protein EngA, putative n=1 Tax=Plasmodium gallinaceum TaxID=5849 RepID=A0A1J1GSU8_PLAGA|nr:GTP-binding protein EngA, putative [Plasmodium gallinaceum]CRG95358.1 GTP-binding protein EngA, putative [Plasmodium gallinaceum]